MRAGQYSLVRYWTFVSETQFHAPSTSSDALTVRASCTSARRSCSTGAVKVTRIGIPTPTVAPSRGRDRCRNCAADSLVEIEIELVTGSVPADPVIVARTS